MTDFPRLSARTRRFSLGEPRDLQVFDRAGLARVLFLRALAGDDPRTGLWVWERPTGGEPGERLLVDPREYADTGLTDAERARRERVRETAAGVVAYHADLTGDRVVTRSGGVVLLLDVGSGRASPLPLPGTAYDPRIDPTGRRVAACDGNGMVVVEVESGRVSPLPVAAADPAGADPEAISWGRAEHVAAEEMGRTRGFWWSPDGETLLVTRVDESEVPLWWIADPATPQAPARPLRYPAAGTRNAAVSLWRFGPGGPLPVRWDRDRFEYLAAVDWEPGHPAVIAVQTRDQRRVQLRAVDIDGSTRLLAEDHGEPWVELHPGTPRWRGEDLVRIADVDGRRRLVVGDTPLGDPALHLRSVAGVLPGGEVVVTGWHDDPASIGVWRVAPDGTTRPLAAGPGVHGAAVGGSLVVLSRRTLTDPQGSWWVWGDGGERGRIAGHALDPPYRPEPDVFTAPGGVRVGVVLPTGANPAGGRLPVLMLPYGGPHAQRVTANLRDWQEPQWWAEQGFAVVVADGRGTPGVSVGWEQAIHRDLAGVVLEDQVTALHAAARRCQDRGVVLDLDRVGIRGWSFGGYLAALAVLRRPDVFHAAVAGAPPTDWRLYDTHYTERYLGVDPADPAYDASSLLDDAPQLSRPLLLVHGLADDNVVAAHTLRLSQRLTEAGRPHQVLPLSGVTHMTPQETVAENLLRLQLIFLRHALGLA